MKIALDASVFQIPPTGIAKVTLGLYEACRKRDPSLDIQMLHHQPLQVRLPAGFRSVPWTTRGVPSRFGRQWALPLYAARARPDAIHFPWNGGVPRGLGRTRVVVTLHDVLPLEIPGHFQGEGEERAYRRKKQRDLDRTDLLITDSEYSKKRILQNFSLAAEPLVVHPGPTLQMAKGIGLEAGASDHSYFLYVGGYHPRKGVDRLLDVFTGLRRAGKLSGRLVLTGSREYFSAAFRKQVEEAVAEGLVEERGYVSDEMLATLLAGARALVYPSKFEGFGLPPLEAMALGCPVITTRGTSLPEVCGDAAVYVDPDDPNDFARALVALEQDDGLRRDRKERGLRQAARFQWEKAAETYLEALGRILGGKGRSP